MAVFKKFFDFWDNQELFIFTLTTLKTLVQKNNRLFDQNHLQIISLSFDKVADMKSLVSRYFINDIYIFCLIAYIFKSLCTSENPYFRLFLLRS